MFKDEDMEVHREKRRMGQIGGLLVSIILGNFSKVKLKQEWHQIRKMLRVGQFDFSVCWMNGAKREK